MSCQHKTTTVCTCVSVYYSGMRACVFLYITTVNMFLAQLNLSKQHTPSWAVKRADRETTERKNSQTRERHSLRKFLSEKLPSVLWKEQRKEGVRDRGSRWGEREREMKVTVCGQQCAEFQLLLKPAPLLNDWVNRREESLFSIKSREWWMDKKKKRLKHKWYMRTVAHQLSIIKLSNQWPWHRKAWIKS